MEKSSKKINVKLILCIVAIVAIIVVAVKIVSAVTSHYQSSPPEIISKSALEKILNVSDLSTFEAVYNGVAKVTNPDNPERVDYYVSYDAKVKAGIDFEKVDISIDDEEKIITVTLPEIKITDVTVDITTLDYIFENYDANTATVSEQAYKHCIEDVKQESSSEAAIYELAEQNARNIVEALIRPFVQQLDDEYQLQIR